MNPPSATPPVEVRYYERDSSVFLDTHYLIKGVAGAIFWKLACENSQRQRSEFSLRELRLAGAELRLPDVQDNLSTRMLLLQRRLSERRAVMQIHKSGRGRFRIELQRPLQLTPMPDPARTRTPLSG
jgi:adenylate cyclase